MFDWVDYECECPRCGAKAGSFQTQSGPRTLETLRPEAVPYFYTECEGCHAWIEVRRVTPPDIVYTFEVSARDSLPVVMGRIFKVERTET